MANGENPGGGDNQQNTPNPWDTLYNEVRKGIGENFKDDKEYIDKKREKTHGYTQEDADRDLKEREALRDEQIGQIDAYTQKLEQMQGRTDQDYYGDFSDETNINSETGKPRSFTAWDVYPIKSYQDEAGNTIVEPAFGERTRRRNDLTVLTDHIPMLQDETPAEYSKRVGQVYADFPRQENENLDSYRQRIEEADRSNELLTSLANHMISPDTDLSKKIEDEFNNIAEMQKNGRFDETKAEQYRREVLQTAINDQWGFDRKQAKATEVEKAKAAAIEKAKATEVEKAKAAAIEKAKVEVPKELQEKEAIQQQIEAELIEREQAKQKEVEREIIDRKEAEQRAIELEIIKRKEAIQQQIEAELARRRGEEQSGEEDQPEEDGPIQDYDKPLAAINADFTADKAELAHDFAEQQLNADVAKSGLIKRIWKGNLFKKYYEKKYEREIMSGERSVETDENGEELTVDDIIKRRSDSAIERFVKGATEEYGEAYIHTKAGEKLTEADARTTEAVKSVIEWYATAKVPEGGSDADLRVEFDNRIKLIQAEARDNGEEINTNLLDNYYKIATQAKQRAESGMAMERVMEGFKVYNADVRNSVRSEAHRDNLDKIIDKIESSAVGSVIPPELVAAAVGSAFGLTQRGARAIAGPALGLGVAGVFAGLRERNRVTEDRARMARDAAVGEEYDSESEFGHAAGKRAKYEARLGGTLYETQSAADLTDRLEQALDSEDESSESLLQAIAEARVRIDMSDSENKDLISYSSADRLGDERLDLDTALIKAERSLSEEDRAKLDGMKESIQNSIYEDIDEKDQDFRKLRTAQAVKQAGKTIAIGSIAFFGSQEIIAAVEPDKIGLLEKAGILQTENTDDASETILAGLAGPRIRVDTIDNISGDDLDSIKHYEDAGYDRIESKAPWTEIKKDLVEVDPADSVHRIKASYDGWANNGTPRVYEGNELGIDLTSDGFVSNMSGNSTMAGQSFDYDSLSSAGDVKGYITVGGAKFEVASTINSSGQITWPIDENGAILTTTGESIPAVGANGEKLYQYFEVALDNGTDANGYTHIMPFATAVGNNSFDGTIEEVRETIIEHPATYSFTKEVPRDVFYGGVIAPVASRVGLGEAATPESEEPSGPEEPEGEEPEGGTPESEEPTEQPGTDSGEAPVEDSESEPEPENNPANTTTEEAPAPRGPNPEFVSVGFDEEDPETRILSSSMEGGSPELPPEDETYHDSIQERFGNLVGESGVDFMTTKRGLGGGDDPAISSWWSSLSDDAKNAVIEFEKSPDNSDYGNMLRAWLQMKNLI